MQSTGQASTQAVSFVPMQGSAITKAISHLCLTEPTVRPRGVGVQAGGITLPGFQRLAASHKIQAEFIPFLLPLPDGNGKVQQQKCACRSRRDLLSL